VLPGDAILGLPSTGVHANGYSLVRRVVAASGLAWDAPAPFAPGRSLAQALLAPTRLYVRPLLALHRAGMLRAAAHITGGGLPGNVPRVLPEGVTAVLTVDWPVAPVFGWLARTGGITPTEMARVFNCGIGMVLVVAADAAGAAIETLREAGESPLRLGEIVRGEGPAMLRMALPPGWPA
jgi:phosphoribosylformylglycinamidine cyclo-ligase